MNALGIFISTIEIKHKKIQSEKSKLAPTYQGFLITKRNVPTCPTISQIFFAISCLMVPWS